MGTTVGLIFLRQCFIWPRLAHNLLNWRWPSICLYHQSSVLIVPLHHSVFEYSVVVVSYSDSGFFKHHHSSFSKVHLLPYQEGDPVLPLSGSIISFSTWIHNCPSEKKINPPHSWEMEKVLPVSMEILNQGIDRSHESFMLWCLRN